ncbi:MAG: hypothetical protein IJR59_02565 [Firmicutes bacterium]|nr:hypothetical protein [Bacillota bacterium]
MRMKLSNKLDDGAMGSVTGGISVSHEFSASEMVNYAAVRTECPQCGGKDIDSSLAFVLEDNAHACMGQKCRGCGYAWTVGKAFEYYMQK